MQAARISSKKISIPFPPPPTVGQWKFLGGGGTKEYKFSKDTTERARMRAEREKEK